MRDYAHTSTEFLARCSVEQMLEAAADFRECAECMAMNAAEQLHILHGVVEDKKRVCRCTACAAGVAEVFKKA